MPPYNMRPTGRASSGKPSAPRASASSNSSTARRVQSTGLSPSAFGSNSTAAANDGFDSIVDDSADDMNARRDRTVVDDTLLQSRPSHFIRPGENATTSGGVYRRQGHGHANDHSHPVAMGGGGPPPVPLKLMARLLYEGFEDKSTKIDKDALSAVTKYIETFVREAMARAAEVRSKLNDDGLGTGDAFLQVGDLILNVTSRLPNMEPCC